MNGFITDFDTINEKFFPDKTHNTTNSYVIKKLNMRLS